MWIIPGHSLPLAGSLLDEGKGEWLVGPTAPPPGGSAGLEHHGGLTLAYEVRWVRFGRNSGLHDGERRLAFRTWPAASRFLRCFRSDPAAMATLRGVLATVAVPCAIHRLRDDAVLDQLTGCLVSGVVIVAVELGIRPRGVAAPPASPSAPQELRRAPSPAPRHRGSHASRRLPRSPTLYSRTASWSGARV